VQYEKSQKKVRGGGQYNKVKGISTMKHRGAIREITDKGEWVNTIKHRGVVREITEKEVQYGNHRCLNIRNYREGTRHHRWNSKCTRHYKGSLMFVQ
jgi:hypothetical protein